MICSSSMRRSSRGTPGVKKKRALPMSSAKPQAVPIGLSRISAVDGSIACFLLFADMTRLRRRKKSSMRSQPILVEDELDPGGARRDLLRQIVDRRPEPAIDDDRIGALAGQPKRREQFLAVVADGRPPAHRQPEILELLGHIAEIGIDDLAGQHFVAGADDLDAHAFLVASIWTGHCETRIRAKRRCGTGSPRSRVSMGLLRCARNDSDFFRRPTRTRA